MTTEAQEVLNYCKSLEPVINIVKAVINLIKWGVPVLLIIWGTIDLAKAVISNKEDEMKKAQGTLLKRAIYAVAVFLVVTLVSLVMNIVADSGTKDGYDKSWLSCWNTGSGENSQKDQTGIDQDGAVIDDSAVPKGAVRVQ